MPRKSRKFGDAHEKIDRREAGRKIPAPRKALRDGKDPVEITAAVCKYVCRGYPATEIVDLMESEQGVKMNREEPYQYLSFAARSGWLTFDAPHAYALRDELKRSCGWLTDFDVVHTSVFEDVAGHGADMLVEMIQRWHLRNPKTKEVHVGVAGGHGMRKLSQSVARLLRRPVPDLPQKIVFHAMVAGFDVRDPRTDPNAFFTYFFEDPSMQVETGFVGFRAPPLVPTARMSELMAFPGVKESYEAAKDLNIIVTSGSCWMDDHSLLHSFMETSPQSLRQLSKAGCIGDILWRPVGPTGPIEIPTATRAMTLLELSQLQQGIQEGNLEVLLVLGPCGACGRPKQEILEPVLKTRPPLLTHLVVDSLSARALLGLEPESQPGNGGRTAASRE